MLNFSVSIDNEKEFDKVLTEYRRWNLRQPAEIVNGKLYFIALQAMQKTKAANKEDIRLGLEAPSKKYNNAPLAAILVNKQLGAKHKKGLTGSKMAQAVEKLIRKQQSRKHLI